MKRNYIGAFFAFLSFAFLGAMVAYSQPAPAPTLGVMRIFDAINSSACNFANQKNCGADVNQVGQIAVDTKPKRITYRANIAGLVPAASATDVFYISGSATKTVTVNRVVVSGTAGTAVVVPVQIIKRSTANSGGTCAASTNVPLDSSDAAATAVVSSCTANPTTGTAVGTVASQAVFLSLSSAVNAGAGEFNFGANNGKPVVLRGTSQVLAVNFNAVSVSSGVVTAYVEWTEE